MIPIIREVISGGQTGADEAAWRAAKAAGLATRGWMPKGFLTEAGPRPEFRELYGARETVSEEYQERTRLNVFEATVTLWFGRIDSPGAKITLREVDKLKRPNMVIEPGRGVSTLRLAEWLQDQWAAAEAGTRAGGGLSVNVAGNRESKAPGIGARTEYFLGLVFELLRRPGS